MTLTLTYSTTKIQTGVSFIDKLETFVLYEGTSLWSPGQDGSGDFPEHLLLYFLWVGSKPFLKSGLGLLTKQQHELNHDLDLAASVVWCGVVCGCQCCL